MQFKGIELKDREIYTKYIEKYNITLEYLSFTTLYTWRNFGKYEYKIFEDELIVKAGYREDTYLIPQNDKESLKRVIDHLSTLGKVNLKGVTKKQAELIEEIYKDRFAITHKRGEDNYVYLTEKMISLSGKKLHSKRNFLNRFKENYSYTYERITTESAKECALMARKWCEKKECESKGSMKNELAACETALSNMNELGLIGGAIRINGEIVAFSLGERLNENTVLIHFEKADTDYTGIYQAINNEFLKNEWEHTLYVNREEDMGIEGLRKAKLSYCPEFLVESYEICDNN